MLAEGAARARTRCKQGVGGLTREHGGRVAGENAVSTDMDTLRQWMVGADEHQLGQKTTTYVNKYLRFALSEHSEGAPKIPIFENFSIVNLMLFVLWASRHGVKGGWDSLSNYVGGVLKWAALWNIANPLMESDFHAHVWAEFRKKVKHNVVTIRQLKLKLQPGHIEAMLQDMRRASREDRQDNALYLWLLFTGLRIGHSAPKSAGDLRHVTVFGDLVFLPSILAPQVLFVYVKSTKTRGVNEGKPWWTAIRRWMGAGPVGEATEAVRCPVVAMQQWVLEAYAGNPAAPVFTSNSRAGRPLNRTEFTTTLRGRLQRAARHLGLRPEEFDESKFSAISFRKGSASILSGNLAVNRLADHFDHADVRSTREYTRDSIGARADNSGIIAASLGWDRVAR